MVFAHLSAYWSVSKINSLSITDVRLIEAGLLKKF
jgi:hypothetical protein